MAKTIQQILHARSLSGVIQAVKPGIPRILPAGFYAPTKNVRGNAAEYTRVVGRRDLAMAVQYGSPSKELTQKGVGRVPVKLWHTFLNMKHDVEVLDMLRAYDNPEVQEMGIQELVRQSGDFATVFENTRDSLMHSALFTGYLYFDSDGNLLPTSSGAMVTVDFGVPASHRNQLDILGAGAIIAASWATAGTDIVAHINGIKSALTQKSGYVPTYAFYGKNIPAYFARNTGIGALLQTDRQLAEGLGSNGTFTLGGITWVNAQDAFFVDQAGAIKTWVGADGVIFSPMPSAEWWELLNGSYVVPTGKNIGGNALDMLADLQRTQGRFSYAELTIDPPGIKHYAGDTFLPTLKAPLAVAIADVTP